jgi:hypothetical protein
MTNGAKVLEMLLPNGGWYISGNEYEGIKFINCEPISKEKFEEGIVQYDAWKSQQEAQKKARKESAIAKLKALGLTEEEVKSIL